MLQYLNHTIDYRRVIDAESLKNILTWIDESYTVHPYMKIQTGGAMSLGWCLIHCISPKHKLNTKISTGAEVFGLSDYVQFNVFI